MVYDTVYVLERYKNHHKVREITSFDTHKLFIKRPCTLWHHTVTTVYHIMINQRQTTKPTQTLQHWHLHQTGFHTTHWLVSVDPLVAELHLSNGLEQPHTTSLIIKITDFTEIVFS